MLAPETLEEFVVQVDMPGISVYSAEIQEMGSDYHFEIQLDNLNSPTGSISLEECEEFSRRFSELVDSATQAGGERPRVLPETLTEENYTMQISSAGAERELRIPADLERFQGQPLIMKYTSDGKYIQRTVNFTGTFEESVGGATEQLYCFSEYVSRRKHARLKKGENLPPEIALHQNDIIKVKLFLDY